MKGERGDKEMNENDNKERRRSNERKEQVIF